VGESEAGSVVEGARDAADAIRKVREDGKRFRRPVVSLLLFLLCSGRSVATGFFTPRVISDGRLGRGLG
jgi:hypothetical protein